MIKTIFFVLIGFFSFNAYAQSLVIYPNIADSLAPGVFQFSVTGEINLPDSVSFNVEFVTQDSIPQMIFEDGFTQLLFADSMMSAFEYDSVAHIFSFPIGTFSHKNFVLNVYTSYEGQIIDQLVINKFEGILNED